MRDEAWQGRRRKLRRRVVLAAAAALLAALVGPPLVSLGHYKKQITRLMSVSLGRPVRLSSVSLRLLPRPGLELSDLTVDEDPAYGAEPVLHANSVTATIRLLSLWRGRLEISSVSMDEASLNLVRSSAGRWNLDPLFRTAAVKGGTGGQRPVHLPYLEATNSRINFKNGVEKLPYSLLNTELSFWQESGGEWRLRLRGEPTRTDLSQEGSDTGTVRLEASVRPAPELREMPVHVDLEWSEAQLGQLTRLMIGSDPGWRGDLTADLHLEGTPDAAQIDARLRATGVHRAEFAPAEALDFDAHCGLIYHYAERSAEKLACDSPLGDGSIRLSGELPGDAEPKLTLELNQIAVQAALDALRTVRNGIAAGVEAQGTISGTVRYAPQTAKDAAAGLPAARAAAGRRMTQPVTPGPISGSLVMENFALSGDGLSQPIEIPKLTLEPVMAARGRQNGTEQAAALTANLAIPLGGTQPLSVAAQLTLNSYRVTLHGQAAIARARGLVHLAGMDATPLDALAGEAMSVDLTAAGPWVPVERNPFATTASAAQNPEDAALPGDDSVTGTVTLHNANWKADYLANHVMIAQAVLHVARYGETGSLRLDPVVFAYGPVRGTASLTVPLGCAGTQTCLPQFEIDLGAVEAGAIQDAFLGAHESGTLLSTLLERLRSSTPPAWPRMAGAVKADSLALGPVTLQAATARLEMEPASATITSLDAGLLGGHLSASGTVSFPQSDEGKPAYTLEAQCTKLAPAAVGALLGATWTGAAMDAAGSVAMSGYTSKDLATTAKGQLHFTWKRGGASGGATPQELTHFDAWTGDAAIANGTITLGDNQAERGGRKHTVRGAIALSEPAKLAFEREAPKKR